MPELRPHERAAETGSAAAGGGFVVAKLLGRTSTSPSRTKATCAIGARTSVGGMAVDLYASTRLRKMDSRLLMKMRPAK